MKRLILYSAVSFDNLIARTDGSVAWLEAPEFRIKGEDFGYRRFLDSVDTTIMGHRTFEQILGFGPPFPYPGTTNYVLTRSARRQKRDEVTFLHKGIPEFIRRLKRGRGKDIWLVGGGQANALLLNHRLIDRIILTFVPVVLGGGIPLFSGRFRTVLFRPGKRKVYPNGFVQITWDKK